MTSASFSEVPRIICTPAVGMLALESSMKDIHFEPDEQSLAPIDENSICNDPPHPMDLIFGNSRSSLHSSFSRPPNVIVVTPPASPMSTSSTANLSSPVKIKIGRLVFKDGRVFQGKHLRGRLINGVMTYTDGSVFEGTWVDNKRHGRGICKFKDGSRYEGDFQAGHFHGYGQLVWGDGGFYSGDWLNGEMHGQGMEVRADGTLRHDGEWRRGEPVHSLETPES